MSSGKKKVFVAMSGGVDSSVAALLLKKDGYDVTGVHMLCWEDCGNNQDKQDAMRVAAHLGIPFLVWNFKKEYLEKVFDYMKLEYFAGRTPNPDVMCNREIKFGVFLKKALEAGADFIATGHYVRRQPHLLSQTDNSSAPAAADYLHSRQPNSAFGGDQALAGCESFSKANEVVALISAKDTSKDQNYFLWTLTQDQLKHCLFPIGGYLKSEVRQIALEAGLPTASKKDSQGLCFVGNINFQEFLHGVLRPKIGEVLSSEGRVLGQHDGAHFYTIGQRHGLAIGGFEEPLYVAEKNIITNTLVIAKGNEDPILYKKELIAEKINWIGCKPAKFPFECFARIRYRQPLQRCIISTNSESGTNKRINLFANSQKIRYSLTVSFDTPQRAVAPGQSIVFYAPSEALAKDDESAGRQVLGGAVIA